MNYKEHIEFLRQTKKITEEEYQEAILLDKYHRERSWNLGIPWTQKLDSSSFFCN